MWETKGLGAIGTSLDDSVAAVAFRKGTEDGDGLDFWKVVEVIAAPCFNMFPQLMVIS